MGRERALSATPLTQVPDVHAAIELTHQARQALGAAGSLPLDAVPDIRPILDRCRAAGSVLDGPELLLLIPTLDGVPRLQAYGRNIRPTSPDIASVTDGLPRLPELREGLARALDADGSVTDRASARLASLRRDIRERRRRLVGELERVLQSPDADRILADRFVTVRHGRYVLPVRADARARMRGIVHDRSQSGQTIFVEPADVVEANNDLVQAIREEEHEVARILAELTDAVRAALAPLDALVDALGELDWTFARASLADRMAATRPIVDAGRTVAVKGARHPLLVAQAWRDPARPVVPVDLDLTSERPLLVITGPNAGGKTIAIKTLALLAAMAQVGCHVPADEGARLPVFESVYAIVGDDQSVAENLSTFSAFVKQIREVLASADARSLVLLDELGAGTDPDEGAALAQAILEELDARGALVMATTHLEPLKAFASTHPHARNASVEFDAATLAPTFRLRYDVPGQSYALSIAGRLGLAPELVERAQAHRSADTARMSELLSWLDEHTRCEAERTLAMERRESETAARLAAAREAEAKAGERAREIVERARADAGRMLAEIRRAIAAEWDRLKRTERSRRSLDDTRRRLSEAAARADVVAPAAAPEAAEEVALEPGARVSAPHLGLQGEVVSIAGATATVRAGSVTVRVPTQALRRAHAAPGGSTRPGAGIKVPDRAAVAPELHLLGRTTDEARDLVEQYLDDAFVAGLPAVRLVHGKGTGALRKTIRELLAGHPHIASFRDGEPSEGGAGATVALLKVG
jgi:DNA mismatch repair protein MutS2